MPPPKKKSKGKKKKKKTKRSSPGTPEPPPPPEPTPEPELTFQQVPEPSPSTSQSPHPAFRSAESVPSEFQFAKPLPKAGPSTSRSTQPQCEAGPSGMSREEKVSLDVVIKRFEDLVLPLARVREMSQRVLAKQQGVPPVVKPWSRPTNSCSTQVTVKPQTQPGKPHLPVTFENPVAEKIRTSTYNPRPLPEKRQTLSELQQTFDRMGNVCDCRRHQVRKAIQEQLERAQLANDMLNMTKLAYGLFADGLAFHLEKRRLKATMEISTDGDDGVPKLILKAKEKQPKDDDDDDAEDAEKDDK